MSARGRVELANGARAVARGTLLAAVQLAANPEEMKIVTDYLWEISLSIQA